MEGLALRALACENIRRRRGAPPSIASTVLAAVVHPKNRGSDDVATADAALLFALAFDAVRQ